MNWERLRGIGLTQPFLSITEPIIGLIHNFWYGFMEELKH